MLYEFCAENFTDIPAAIAAGAQRIELCDNLAVGGTSPSYGVTAAAVEYAHAHGARIMFMVRPRKGDFVYSGIELAMMKRDAQIAVGLGVDGVVLGCLKGGPERYVLDMEASEEVIHAASGVANSLPHQLDVTFHMAFDELSDEEQLNAIDALSDIGVTRILTHGGPSGTPIRDNVHRLAELQRYAEGKLIILPGGGITYRNRDTVARMAQARELHGTKIVYLSGCDLQPDKTLK